MELEKIIQLRDEKQKQLTALLKNKGAVDEEYGEVSLAIAKLEVRKGELRNAKTKAGSLIQILRVEIDNLKDAYFNAKAQ